MCLYLLSQKSIYKILLHKNKLPHEASYHIFTAIQCSSVLYLIYMKKLVLVIYMQLWHFFSLTMAQLIFSVFKPVMDGTADNTSRCVLISPVYQFRHEMVCHISTAVSHTLNYIIIFGKARLIFSNKKNKHNTFGTFSNNARWLYPGFQRLWKLQGYNILFVAWASTTWIPMPFFSSVLYLNDKLRPGSSCVCFK